MARASQSATHSLAREAVCQTYLVVLFIGVDTMGFMLSECFPIGFALQPMSALRLYNLEWSSCQKEYS